MFEETDSEVCKVIINVEDTQFVCSRKILSEHSPYFNAMFNGNFIEKDEKIVNIQQVKTNGFYNILKTISDAKFSIEYCELLDTLQCACMLQFEKIRSHCINRLTDKLSLDQCLQIWFETEALNIHPLSEKAKCKALIHFNYLRNNYDFMKLNIKQLHSYLSSTLLYCDNEFDVFATAMKWWLTFSKTLKDPEKRDDIGMQYLMIILNCIDFQSVSKIEINQMLMYPDIKCNDTLYSILKGIRSLIHNTAGESSTELDKQTKELFYKVRKRYRILLPCVVTTERKATSTERDLNISYYDIKNKCLRKVFDSYDHLETICAAVLTGAKFMEYKGDLLLFGGEFHFGTSNWNKDVWMYDTCRNKWKILTKFPIERRHFRSCIIDDKLFIIGGTGKFRIRHSDSLFYYNFRTGEWVTNLSLPYSLTDISICEFRKQLYIMPGGLFRYGYLFNTKTKTWQKISITDPLHLVSNYPVKYLIFAKRNSIFIKGINFLELAYDGSSLEVKRFVKDKPIYGDTLDYYTTDHHLYLFSKHNSPNNVIYTIHRYNLETNSEELLIQVNDSIDTAWHIDFGCFSYFHHSLAKDSLCISEFTL